jgi:hypothetical protein
MHQVICGSVLLVLVLVILLGMLVMGIMNVSGGKLVDSCQLIEYDQPPNDDQSEPTEQEWEMLKVAEEAEDEDTEDEEPDMDADLDTSENFRIHGGGRRGRGGRGRGRRGRGRHWRPWPIRHYARPWRSYLWRTWPNNVYTYPLTYYTYNWSPPVQRFTIRIGPKGDNHPFAGKGSDLGYMIAAGTGYGCGTSGAYLQLKYDQPYEFDIYTSKDCVTGETHNQPFFFTTDPEGGSANGAILSVQPTVNGTIRVTFPRSLSDKFYYQSTNGEYVGGYVSLS